MSALDSSELIVGQTGTLYVGDVGTAFPVLGADVDTGDWTELGYIDTDGVKFNFPSNLQWIRGWQSRHPIRGVKGDIDSVVGFNLQQWNVDSIGLAFGGPTITPGAGSDFRVTPPDESTIAEVAFLVDGRDGDLTVRFGAARAVNQAATTFQWARSAESKLAIELMLLASNDDTVDWFLDFFTVTGS